MTSSTLASTLALVGIVGGFGLLGLIIGRDLDRNGSHGRDNWHRPGGYPADPRPSGNWGAASRRPDSRPEV